MAPKIPTTDATLRRSARVSKPPPKFTPTTATTTTTTSAAATAPKRAAKKRATAPKTISKKAANTTKPNRPKPRGKFTSRLVFNLTSNIPGNPYKARFTLDPEGRLDPSKGITQVVIFVAPDMPLDTYMLGRTKEISVLFKETSRWDWDHPDTESDRGGPEEVVEGEVEGSGGGEGAGEEVAVGAA